MQLLAEHLYEASASTRVRVQTPARTLADTIAARKLRWSEMSAGDRNMREVSSMFTDQFADWSDDRRRAFLAFFTSNVLLTVVYVENPSLAYQIFVAANARGLDLEIGDITKGQLVELVSQNGGSRALIETTAAEWTRTQRLLRGGFDDFLNAVEVLKFRPDQKHALGELLLDLFDETSDPAEISTFVTHELSRMARAFEPCRTHLGLSASRGVHLSFRQLSFLHWKDWQPFYLALALAHEDRPDRLDEAIPKLQRACFMFEVLGWSERTRRRAFLKAISQLEDGLDPFRARQKGKVYGSLYFSPKFRRLARQSLRQPFIEDDRRGSIVRWIETLHWGEEVPKSCTDDTTIEHVLPRTAIGEWQKRFTEDERERLTNRLGNLCLLPADKNADLGNKDWIDKVKVYETMTGSSERRHRRQDRKGRSWQSWPGDMGSGRNRSRDRVSRKPRRAGAEDYRAGVTRSLHWRDQYARTNDNND
ncbi:MAG: HNH endonuclease family protein [Hyphomicrobiaceae bacterium]